MKTINASKVKNKIIFVKDKKRYVLDEDGNKLYLVCDKCKNSNWESIDKNPLHVKSKCGEVYALG